MKRFLAVIFAMTLIFSSVPMRFSYAETGQYQDTAFDQVGDWFATLGKQGDEKDRILAERKAERLKHFIEKNADQAAKDAQAAGEDAKKKLGF